MICPQLPRLEYEAISATSVCVEPRLLDLVRALPAAGDGVEVVVDCEPPGLAVGSAEIGTLERCCRLLLDSALAGAPAREVDLSVRADRRGEAPMICLSMRKILADAGAPEAGDEGRIAQRELDLVQGGTRAILVARRVGLEKRLSVALAMPFETLAEPAPTLGTPTRVLVADDSAQVRRVVRRLLERRGFEVAEAAGAVDLLAALDPLRCAVAPDVVLVDEDWLRPDPATGSALANAVEAVVPAERVVRLSNRRAQRTGAARRLVKPLGGDELQASLGAGSPPARKAEAEIPYSLSL